MRIGEEVVEDYRRLHLSLKAHPVAFLRAELDRRGILRHDRLAAMPSGRRVTVAGLVLVRQRPGSANGVIFMTLEDEAAIANVIVWPKIFEAFRPVVLGARLVAVTGKLQNEFGVIHVVADRLDDLTALLRRLAADHRCVEALAHGDQVKHGGPPSPPQRATPAPRARNAIPRADRTRRRRRGENPLRHAEREKFQVVGSNKRSALRRSAKRRNQAIAPCGLLPTILPTRAEGPKRITPRRVWRRRSGRRFCRSVRPCGRT